jgi:hypothetical protein
VKTVLDHRSGLGFSEQSEHGLFAGAGGVDAGGSPDHYDQAHKQRHGQTHAAAAQTLGNATNTVAHIAHDLLKI